MFGQRILRSHELSHKRGCQRVSSRLIIFVGPLLDDLGEFKVSVTVYSLPVLLGGRGVDFMTSKGPYATSMPSAEQDLGELSEPRSIPHPLVPFAQLLA